MKLKVKIPKMGLTTEQVTLSSWSKGIGDAVEANEVIAVVEADKTSVEIASPMKGVVAEYLVEVGAEVPVGEAIAVVQT